MRPYSYTPTPYKRQKPATSIKAKLLSIFALLIFGGFFYLFFLSPVFQIKEVTIYGNAKISENSIRQEIAGYIERPFIKFWKPKNILLFNSEKVSNRLMNSNLLIASTYIKKNYFHNIEITVEEREIFAIYCDITYNLELATHNFQEATSDSTFVIPSEDASPEPIDCYYIDEKGIVFGEAPESIGSLIMTIKKVSEKETSLGNKVLNQKTAQLLKEVKGLFEKQNLRITEFLIKESSEDIEVSVSEGWAAYIDTKIDIEDQIDVLDKVLKEKIDTEDREVIKYIDLRIPDRVYYQ